MSPSAATSSPVVQALLTADTLIDHFLRAVQTISRSMSDQDTRSREIGDANATYLAIWEHLDRARQLLVDAGRDVAEYDQLRAQVSTAAVGVDTHIEVLPLWQQTRYREQVLHAQFNKAGIDAAGAASAALKRSAPSVDWRAIAAVEAAPVARLTSGVWKVWLTIGLLLVALFGGTFVYFRYFLD